MTLLLVLLLAVLQGLTEFLPVSSSGHLRLLQAAFDLEDPQTAVDVVLHVGTLVAVCLVYRADLIRVLQSVFRSGGRLLRGEAAGTLAAEPDTRLALLLIVGTIPAGLLGVLAGGLLESHLTGTLFVGVFLIGNGFILMLGGRTPVARGEEEGRPIEELGIRDALLVGMAQAFALLRGISRSGTTISAALLLGIRREDAARFSFLLSVPAILGAAVLELRHLEPGEGPGALALAAGAAVAAVVGWGALRLLLHLVRNGRLDRFAWYCWALGLTAIVLTLGLA